MASIFSKIGSMFSGGGEAGSSKEGEQKVRQIQGLTVFATPQKEGAQYRISGRIEKEVDGEILVRHFIRADMFSNEGEAAEASFQKAELIIRQTGNHLFADGKAEGMA